jgi:glycosyltransferase involved in cell wall biosynthesis
VVRRLAINLSTAFSNQADLVIAPSYSIATRLSFLGVTSRIEVVPTGVDLKQFAPGDREAARRQLGLPGDAIILLSVGRLDKEKSVEFLLKVFDAVGSLSSESYLVLVGQGKAERPLKALASKLPVGARVLFVGAVPSGKVAEYHRASDLFLFASQTETQGLAVAEAQASGLPVVAVRASGVEEVIRDGETGLLLPAEVKQFAGATHQLLFDTSRRRRMGELAREVISKQFSAEQSVARHVEL